jgi:hypothetical protein
MVNFVKYLELCEVIFNNRDETNLFQIFVERYYYYTLRGLCTATQRIYCAPAPDPHLGTFLFRGPPRVPYPAETSEYPRGGTLQTK